MAKIALGKACFISLTVECSECVGGFECLIVLAKVSSISAREVFERMFDLRCRLRRKVLSGVLDCA
jgi:hypothetical protein